MTKPIAFVTDAALICGEDKVNKEEGKWLLNAQMIIDGSNRIAQNIDEGMYFISTPIIRIDLEKRTVETANTIYQIIPKSQRETLLLLVPKSQMIPGASSPFPL